MAICQSGVVVRGDAVGEVGTWGWPRISERVGGRNAGGVVAGKTDHHKGTKYHEGIRVMPGGVLEIWVRIGKNISHMCC